MTYSDILELATATAAKLGIRITNPALIIKNLTPAIGVTTILWNEDYTLWVDKHYIAYGRNRNPEILYLFTDMEHVDEELRSVCARVKGEKSPYVRQTLTSVKDQLRLAGAAMSKSGGGLYFFEETELFGTEGVH
jgi:DNA-binding Lrp family transcriptional regulator